MIELVLNGIYAVVLLVGLIAMLGATGGGYDIRGIVADLSALLFVSIIVSVVAFILVVSILFLPYAVVSMFHFSLPVRHRQIRLPSGKADRNLQTIEQPTNLTLFISLILITI